MGKTKTAFVGSTEDKRELSGAEKYKLRQVKKLREEALSKAAVPHVGLKGGEKIKVVGADEPIVENTIVAESDSTGTPVKQTKVRLRGKKYTEAKKKFDRTKSYKTADAIKLVRDTSYSKFDATLEMHLTVGKVGLNVNVTLPHSFGKEKKVEIADEKTVENLKKGTVNFDVLLATPEMMPKLVPFARLLGPKGLMPNPKAGTLIKDKKDASKFNTSVRTLKTEKEQPVIHTVAGKLSQTDKELLENVEEIVNAIGKKIIVKAFLTSSMSPSVRLQV